MKATTSYIMSQQLQHGSDGPVTPFVVVYRACVAAAGVHSDNPALVANALAEALEECGVSISDSPTYSADS